MLRPQNWGCLAKDITRHRGDIVQQQFLVLCEGLQEINWRNLASHDQSVEDDLESIYYLASSITQPKSVEDERIYLNPVSCTVQLCLKLLGIPKSANKENSEFSGILLQALFVTRLGRM